MDFSFAKVLQIYLERWPWFLGMIGQQLFISLVSIAIAGTLGLLIGIFIAEHRRFAEPVIAVCNVFYTIPAIALIALLIPIAGIGAKNAVIAIILYGLMPMVRNTYTGITSISPELLDAAVGMGSTPRQILMRIKLPLASATILAGVRTLAVMSIATGSIAAFIGGGGLGGIAINYGYYRYQPALMWVAVVLLVVLVQIIQEIGMRFSKAGDKRIR